MKHLFTMLLLLLSLAASAQSTYDQLQPFGFATVSSRTENVPYNLTGGGAYTYPVTEGDYVVVKASGKDDDTDYNAIRNAINQHDIVILDGSDGAFTITQTMSIDGKSNKTILGINNARLCTKFYITSEIKAALDAANVSSKSTSSDSGGDLIWKPGTDEEEKIAYVSEERELVTRQVLLALTQDKTEAYRKSGIFKFSTACSNIIIRNIQFEGPGPFDCSGNDLMWLNSSTTHIWVDHCTFIDGMDGNFDISNGSDFITVSWCKFYYTERAYDHMNTNLVGSSDNNESVDGGKLNVTFAYNHWGTLCRQRMPMTRYGKIHMLNNYYTCTGNTGSCINPRKNSEFLIEGNYFDSSLTNVFGTNSASAWVWSNSHENIIASGIYPPSSSGSCSVPYTYSTSLAASDVPAEVGNNAGNILFDFSACNITSCTVAGNEATIDGTNITYEVPYSYSTTIPVTLTLSDGATADSGTSFNMTLSAEGGAHTSKSIVVTSGDGQNQKTYTLTVTREPVSYNITWVFDTGAAGQTASMDDEVAAKVKSTSVELGSNLSYNGSTELKINNTSLSPQEYSTKILQGIVSSEPDESLAMKFLIKPKTGVTFTPKSVSFRATRCGTDGGKMTIQWYDANAANPVALGTTAASKEGKGSTDPARDSNTTKNWTDYSYDLVTKGAEATTGECGLKIILYDASGTNLKSYAYSNIVITGTFSGSNTKELTLGQNGYSTFAGEYNYTVSGDGVGAYTANYDSEKKSVSLTACAANAVIAKGAGIVLKGVQAGDAVTITYTDDEATVSDTGLEGVISTTESISSNPYVLASKGTQTAFVKAGAYGTVNALMNKAYLNGEANNLQNLPITLEEEATGIDNINGNGNDNINGNTPTKVIKNGKLYIGNYNIVGQQVK